MHQRKSWKYKKDIFGRKHRINYLQDIFGLDVANLKTFKSLKTKLDRDYSTFFSNIYNSYKKGELKNVAKEAIGKTSEAINLVESIIDSGTVDKKDVDELTNKIMEINAEKDFFVQKSQENKSLLKRLENIQEETGVSSEDLNISKETIRLGAKREFKKTKEGIVPFLQRTTPRTLGTASKLGRGAATALLGPFSPLAEMGLDITKDIFGLGKGIAQKIGERREAKLEKKLRPSAYGMTAKDIEKIQAMRRYGYPISKTKGYSTRTPRERAERFEEQETKKDYKDRYREESGEESRSIGSDILSRLGFGKFSKTEIQTEKTTRSRFIPSSNTVSKKEIRRSSLTLKEFFDKDAYKAKWTKELLKNIKNLTKKSSKAGVGGLSGLLSNLKSFSVGLLPFLGKAGLFAALAIGVGLSIKKFHELGKSIFEFTKSKKQVGEAGERAGEAATQKLDVVKGMGIGEYAKKAGTTTKGIALDITNLEQRKALSERTKQPWYKKTLQSYGLMKRPELVNTYERAAEIEKQTTKPKEKEIPTKSSLQPTKSFEEENKNKEVIESNKKLADSINKLSNEMKSNRYDNIKGTGLGDPYDSGDSLIRDHASGKLGINGD